MQQPNVWDHLSGQPGEHINPLKLSWQEYGEVTKRDIFHYVYGILNHPTYALRYAENLKRDLPRIPKVRSRDAFWACSLIGVRLMDLHLHYEQMPGVLLEEIWTEGEERSYHVEKMRLVEPEEEGWLKIAVNESLTLAGIPSDVLDYQLGNRSALEWVIDQYQIRSDERSGIVSDPNNPEDSQSIVRLIGQVVYVSLMTLGLRSELEARVPESEWTGETMENPLEPGGAYNAETDKRVYPW